MNPLLQVRKLGVQFRTTRGVVKAVEDLSFEIQPAETVAIVGESGSGKSTAALALLRLIADPPGRITSGSIVLSGQNLLELDEDGIRAVRGRSISMIFQDPMMALNPVHTIGRQIGEVLRAHLGMPKTQALAKAIELLQLVGVPAPEQRIKQYPHNLSGGMRQRVMIAMALACRPQLLIADEPTTALDVTIQAQVLDLIRELKKMLGMSVLLITHDLAVVAEIAQRVVVMYAGRKVEEGTLQDIYGDPQHPYTQGLLNASRWEGASGGLLPEIPGVVPSPFAMPTGCAFSPRCSHVVPRCREEVPQLVDVAPGRPVACFVAQGQS
jgi:peptide/nickel transport system ATP-binding protein